MTDAAPKRQEVKHLFSSPVFSTSTPTPRPYFTIEPIPSPASTVASLTRELEDTLQTLDLHTAMQGQYVVKPQVFTNYSMFTRKILRFDFYGIYGKLFIHTLEVFANLYNYIHAAKMFQAKIRYVATKMPVV